MSGRLVDYAVVLCVGTDPKPEYSIGQTYADGSVAGTHTH
jgi:hypothetical protein